MLITLIVLILLVLWGVYELTIGVEWSTHKDMVKSNTKIYGYGSYEDFKREFDRIEWTHRPAWSDSLFDDNSNSKYHANIIKFESKGMIIKDPFSHVLVRLYVRQAIEQISSKNLVNWSSNSQNLEVTKK